MTWGDDLAPKLLDIRPEQLNQSYCPIEHVPAPFLVPWLPVSLLSTMSGGEARMSNHSLRLIEVAMCMLAKRLHKCTDRQAEQP